MTNKDLILNCRDRKTRLERPCHKCPYMKKECWIFKKTHEHFTDPSYYSRIVNELDNEIY